MILLINTTDRKNIKLGLFDGKTLSLFEFETEKQSEEILSAIAGIIKNAKLQLSDIKAILVHQGPGSYTGVRVGATVANTLAWSLNIPVLGYQDDLLDKTLIKASQQHHFKDLALPCYDDILK